MALTKEDRIKTVYGGGGQVVILGAGASIASTIRNSELSGKRLPSMENFIEVVGLNDIVSDLPNLENPLKLTPSRQCSELPDCFFVWWRPW